MKKKTYLEDEPKFNWVNETLQAISLIVVAVVAALAFIVWWGPRTGI